MGFFLSQKLTVKDYFLFQMMNIGTLKGLSIGKRWCAGDHKPGAPACRHHVLHPHCLIFLSDLSGLVAEAVASSALEALGALSPCHEQRYLLSYRGMC